MTLAKLINIEQLGLIRAGYCWDFLWGPMAVHDVSQPANGRTLRTWQEIAREVTQEHDPAKVRTLSAELNQAMLEEERRKVRLRFGHAAAMPETG